MFHFVSKYGTALRGCEHWVLEVDLQLTLPHALAPAFPLGINVICL